MIKKRLGVSLFTGALLGVVCIIGANIRGTVDSSYMLFALWYNRMVMAVMIGVVGREDSFTLRTIRGAVFGLVVSFAYFASAGFTDVVSFAMGIVYGIIIEFVAYRFGE